ncbi:MAG: methionine--tRNA ligase subunit beta [Candidatus Anammoxibacter sp.]
MISIEDFAKIDLRVAKIKSAEAHPNADKLLILKIDAGDGIEDRQLVAGIKAHYNPEELVGKNVIIVNNLAPVVLRGEESQGMVLAASDGDDVILLTSDKDVAPGSTIR